MQLKLIAIFIVLLIMSSLAGGMYYYKAQYEKAIGQLKVAQIERDTLKAANQSLKDEAAKVATQMNNYMSSMQELSDSNQELNKKLSVMQTKLAKHKLQNLRNGRHSDLVLKVINRSIIKQNEKWFDAAVKQPTKVQPAKPQAKPPAKESAK